MACTFDIEPLDGTTFGAVVHGIKVMELDEPAFRALYDAWLEHALLIFPAQFLTHSEQIAFAKRFGPLEFEMTALSNVKADGTLRREADNDDMMKVLKGNMGWHHDSTYMPVQAKGAVFSAEMVPTVGGKTGFADMRAAYDALDAEMKKRLEPLAAYHSLHYSQSKLGHDARSADGEYSGYGFHSGPVPLRPLVKAHPETGRKSLLAGRHAHNIPGLDAAESERLLEQLTAFACQPPRIYHHDWKPGDAVVWDNRCLMHRATPWDMTQPRVMWHSRIAGDPRSEGGAAGGGVDAGSARHGGRQNADPRHMPWAGACRRDPLRNMERGMSDLVAELRAQCLAAHDIPSRPEGPTPDECRLLQRDPRWRAADEIEKLRHVSTPDWQPMSTAPRDRRVLLYCPGLSGNVADEVVVGMWKFDPNRRTLGYWASDVGVLDGGFAETGPWIEYPELKPERWAPLLACPAKG